MHGNLMRSRMGRTIGLLENASVELSQGLSEGIGDFTDTRIEIALEDAEEAVRLLRELVDEEGG